MSKVFFKKNRESIDFLVYQSNIFDLYFQFSWNLWNILFHNNVEGIILRKVTLVYPNTYYKEIKHKYNQRINYGLYLDLQVLGLRFGIYFCPITFKYEGNNKNKNN